jgi:hypothetical protein
MPDLAGMLMRSSIGALSPPCDHCHECRRTPLAGEHLHQVGSGPVLCDLCFGVLPEEQRLSVRSVRVHASERPIAAVRKAA